MTIIEVKCLNKFFGHKQVLHDVGFSVNKKEILALIGPSGSGKSTLLKHLNGLSVSHQGDIYINGQSIVNNGTLSVHIRKQRTKIGFIFQQFNLIKRLNVIDNVLIGALGKIHKLRGTLKLFNAQEKKEALHYLERVGLADLANQRTSTLSGGQQQRVAIAKVLMQKADIILADEPIASLDPTSAHTIMSLLRDIHDNDHKTVIVTLHQFDFAKQYCNHAIGLKNGRIIYDGDIISIDPAFLTTLYEQDQVQDNYESDPLYLNS